MGRDQVLVQHQITNNLFELSALRTGGIRDQIVRANLLVRRLRLAGVIGLAKPLLIIGGGVAGVEAAITAASLGIDVTILEKNRTFLFSSQLIVKTRLLDPCEFDWPHLHWHEGDIEWDGSEYALPYQTATAAHLAARWTTLVNQLLLCPPKGYGNLWIKFGVEVLGSEIKSTVRGVELNLRLTDLVGQSSVAAAISCVGAAREFTSIASKAGGYFEGPKFWSNDEFAHHDFGNPSSEGRPLNILVSGAGDGAQQDFLRILTGRFGRGLYFALQLDELEFDLNALLLADDHARRCHAWSAIGDLPYEAYEKWHQSYVDLVNQIWDVWIEYGKVSALSQLLMPRRWVTWLVGSQTPGYCYGLNRLLAMLVARLHAYDTGRTAEGGRTAGYHPNGTEVALFGCRLASVAPLPNSHHICSDTCSNLGHTVYVKGDGRLVGSEEVSLGDFQAIVIRHGVDQRPLFAAAPISEQLVPMARPR